MDFIGERYFPEQSWAFWKTGDFPMNENIELFQRQRLDAWADELARSPRHRFYIERFLLNLLHELHPAPQTAWPSEMPTWLLRALQEIERPEHFTRGVAGFVSLTGYSREHATRCLRQFVGITPTDLVNRARMAHAAHLLVMSHQSIIEIGLSCGLDNLSHFYVLFRAHYGMTPRAYRSAHRKTF
jgi:AraC family cel operon transcriptional repressor